MRCRFKGVKQGESFKFYILNNSASISFEYISGQFDVPPLPSSALLLTAASLKPTREGLLGLAALCFLPWDFSAPRALHCGARQKGEGFKKRERERAMDLDRRYQVGRSFISAKVWSGLGRSVGLHALRCNVHVWWVDLVVIHKVTNHQSVLGS